MENDTPYVLITKLGKLIELPTGVILDDWEICVDLLDPASSINAPE